MPLRPHDPEEFDTALFAPALTTPPAQPAHPRRMRALRVISGFLLGQGAAQGIAILASLFLVRVVSVESYAQFGLATSVQNVFSVLMDLGFAGTIIPMVGDRRDDLALVGRYVRAAKHLRDRSFWVLAPVAAIAFLAILHKHHWAWHIQLLLLASVLLNLHSGGRLSYFSAPLFVFGRLREYYVTQVISGAARFAAYLTLFLGGILNGWTAAVLSALSVSLNGSLLSRTTRKHLVWPADDDPATNRELLKYILPATPALIFSAFQSQISLFLVSVFGGTLSIAEVAALGRIGQLFTVLMTFNIIVVEPFIARHPRKRLFRMILGLVLLASAACIPFILLAYFYPGAYLIVIGSRYNGVRDLMGWYILGSCINFVAGLIWLINRARKWVFWSGSILQIGLVLAAQVAYVLVVGVRTTRQAVLFSVITAVCVLIAHTYVTLVGFFQENRVPTETRTPETLI